MGDDLKRRNFHSTTSEDGNGEGIYGTTFWKVYGEGPTEIPSGSFTDVDRQPFTSKDIRFTCKGSTVYAFVLKYPEDGQITINSLRRALDMSSDIHVESVEMMDGETCLFRRDEAAGHYRHGTSLQPGNPDL